MKKKKDVRILKKKIGPVAHLGESMYVGTKRHFWVVYGNVGIQVTRSPKEAKAAWRIWNAAAWQKKVTQ
jgi:hypothetical protein